MKALTLALIATAVAVSIAAVAAAIYFIAREDEEEIPQENVADELKEVEYLSVPPPEPTFNSNDNTVCRGIITEYYEYALAGYTGETEAIAALAEGYEDVLTAQRKTGIEIVNNEDFLNWMDSGYEDCSICTKYYPAPPEEKPEYLLEFFMPAKLGIWPPAEKIRSVD